jgi:phosphoribosylformimino-5-aminoimidazole carboxamide ribonucleotide (ProFAR) isomerase
MKQNDKRRLFDKNSREVDISEILLHDLDNKGLIQGQNGKLYYQDLNKAKLIQ